MSEMPPYMISGTNEVKQVEGILCVIKYLQE